MFGWRKRIGYIGPTVMEVVPYEFYRFAPEGVGLVGVTCNIDDWSQQYFDQALAQVTTAAAYLGSRGVDFILHGGGPLVVARGKGFRGDHSPRHRGSRESAGVDGRAGSDGGAAPSRRAPHRDRLALSGAAQPRRFRPISLAQGFEIVGAEGMDVPFKSLQSVPLAEIETFARGVLARCGGCDALYLPCPQWQAAQVVATLEQDVGVPAVAYTHASFFVAFKALGLHEPIRGHGRLLASLAEMK